jgi:hypothetical protein
MARPGAAGAAHRRPLACNDADRLETFRRVRDQIAARLQHWLKTDQS